MWNPPRLIEFISLVLAGGLLSTVPPGKSSLSSYTRDLKHAHGPVCWPSQVDPEPPTPTPQVRVPVTLEPIPAPLLPLLPSIRGSEACQYQTRGRGPLRAWTTLQGCRNMRQGSWAWTFTGSTQDWKLIYSLNAGRREREEGGELCVQCSLVGRR